MPWTMTIEISGLSHDSLLTIGHLPDFLNMSMIINLTTLIPLVVYLR